MEDGIKNVADNPIAARQRVELTLADEQVAQLRLGVNKDIAEERRFTGARSAAADQHSARLVPKPAEYCAPLIDATDKIPGELAALGTLRLRYEVITFAGESLPRNSTRLV